MPQSELLKRSQKNCATCHQEGLGANPFVGPELNGIVRRDAASVANYTKYSDGLKKAGFVWTEEKVDRHQRRSFRTLGWQWHSNEFLMLMNEPTSLLI